MNILKPKVTRRNTIKAIPITNRYLSQNKSGLITWDSPNDSWSMFSNSAGNKQIIANVQRDTSEHSPDLFLYSNLNNQDYRKNFNDVVQDLMEGNRIQIDRSRNWYLRQFTRADRVGPKRFTGLPLQAFFHLWRCPLDPKQIELARDGTGRMKFVYKNWSFPVYFVWNEMQQDMNLDGRSNKVLPWLQKHCKGGLFLFSDYESVFEDPDDEFYYTADLC